MRYFIRAKPKDMIDGIYRRKTIRHSYSRNLQSEDQLQVGWAAKPRNDSCESALHYIGIGGQMFICFFIAFGAGGSFKKGAVLWRGVESRWMYKRSNVRAIGVFAAKNVVIGPCRKHSRPFQCYSIRCRAAHTPTEFTCYLMECHRALGAQPLPFLHQTITQAEHERSYGQE